jgi:two-component system sensor histidine kinase BarA
MTMQFRLKSCHFSPILLPCIFAVALIAGLWSVALYQMGAARENYLTGATRDAENFATSLTVRTERAIDVIDQTVDLMKFAYDEQGAGLNIKALISGGVISADIFNRVSVLDRDANVLLSSTLAGAAKVAASPLVFSAVASNAALFAARAPAGTLKERGKLSIHKPLAGPDAGTRVIQMTRRRNRPDGSFNGAIVAAIDPLYFSRIYDSVDLGRQGTISLVGNDGIIRARRSSANDSANGSANDSANGSANDPIGRDEKGTPMFKSMAQYQHGAMRAVSTIDGIDRIWAYRKLEDQALYVVVGVGVDDRLKPFIVMQRQLLALAVFSSLLILVFTGLLIMLIRRLGRARELAMAESHNKTVLLSNMSHELRTPLNGILGYAELLKEELFDAEKRSFAQYIHDSGTHLLSLVNSLLQISKIEAGEVSVQWKGENLSELLSQAINTHASNARAKGLVLSLAMGRDLPPELICDRMRLLQVLNNLLHNAIKFTASGKVELAVSAKAQGIRFSVADTGAGVAPELREAIFNSFFQVERHSMQGTGLGLAIAKQLVELMGGSIGVESTPGHGATFFFILPLKVAP